MAQADYNIDATVTPAQLRAEVNLNLAAIASNNAGPDEPTPAVAHMLWADTLNGYLKQRNSANTAWLVIGRLDRPGLDLHVLRRLLYRLADPLAGADVAIAQNILGVGAPLETGIYEFELLARLAKTAGTTSHGLSVVLAGTATLAGVAYSVDIDSAGIGTPGNAAWITTANAAPVVSGISAATVNITLRARGTLSVSGAGTLVPQYQLSTAPGAAYTTQAGSFMSLLPVGAVTTGALNLGGWT